MTGLVPNEAWGHNNRLIAPAGRCNGLYPRPDTPLDASTNIDKHPCPSLQHLHYVRHDISLIVAMNPQHKSLAWTHCEVTTPPFSTLARVDAGFLLRRLQREYDHG